APRARSGRFLHPRSFTSPLLRGVPWVARTQALDVMNKVPGLVGIDRAGEGRHGSPVHAGDKDPVDVRTRIAALDVTLGEVVRSYRVAPVVFQLVRGWPISKAGLPVTLGAVGALVDRAAVFDRLLGERRFSRNRDGRLRFVGLPAGREPLNVGDHVEAAALA